MWYVYSNLFGSSSRVISGALVQSNLLTYFRRNTRQKVKFLVRSRGGGGGGVGEVAVHRDLLTTAQF